MKVNPIILKYVCGCSDVWCCVELRILVGGRSSAIDKLKHSLNERKKQSAQKKRKEKRNEITAFRYKAMKWLCYMYRVMSSSRAIALCCLISFTFFTIYGLDVVVFVLNHTLSYSYFIWFNQKLHVQINFWLTMRTTTYFFFIFVSITIFVVVLVVFFLRRWDYFAFVVFVFMWDVRNWDLVFYIFDSFLSILFRLSFLRFDKNNKISWWADCSTTQNKQGMNDEEKLIQSRSITIILFHQSALRYCFI